MRDWVCSIPIIQPIPLRNDLAPTGSPQPIIQMKELAVDKVRYHEWKMLLTKPRKPIAKL